MKNYISRRDFLAKSAAAAFGLMILPSWAAGKGTGPNGKLNVALIGVGGRGGAAIHDLGNYDKCQFVAFCDVDEARAGAAYKQFPDVPRFKDYRVMFDKMGKDIDAVAIATPDHAHFPAAAWALANGKHVFVEKPLSRTIWESRELKRISKKTGLITQLGNQGHTYDGWRKLKEWYDAGILGDIQEIYHWTDRPNVFWKQGKLNPPDGSEKVPAHLDFNLWLNVAPDMPYSRSVAPFAWRGLQNFGTSALGDMGCHFMDWGYSAFDLGLPSKITGTCTEFSDYAWPEKSTVTYEWEKTAKRPAIKLHWFDSYVKPQNVKGVEQDFINKHDNGSIAVCSKETVTSDSPYGDHTMVRGQGRMQELQKSGALPKPTLPRISGGPHKNWVDACIAGVKAESDIGEYGAEFNELVLLGLITNFFPGETLEYDAKKMSFKNKKANAFLESRYAYKKEFLPGKI